MEREESFQKVHPLHTLEGKHSELWHSIFVRCFDTVITPLWLGACVISMYRSVTRMILSSHKITYAPSQGGVVTVSTTHKILCQSSECLPSGCGEEVCIPKLFWKFSSLSISYFEKYSNNIYLKNSTKSCPKYFWNKS